MSALAGLVSFAPFVLFSLLIGSVIALMLWLRARRRKRLMAWAASKGFWFEDSDHGLADRFPGFEPFGVGRKRQAWHVIKGKVGGVDVVLFQYHYTVQSGKDSQTHVQQVCVLRTRHASPGLSVRRERIHHKLFDALGGEDIDFESDEFSRRFWVRGPNRRFVYDVIHPRMMEYLMPRDGFLWQWRGQDLMLVRSGYMEPAGAEAMLVAGTGFLALLPRHLDPSPS